MSQVFLDYGLVSAIRSSWGNDISDHMSVYGGCHNNVRQGSYSSALEDGTFGGVLWDRV